MLARSKAVAPLVVVALLAAVVAGIGLRSRAEGKDAKPLAPAVAWWGAHSRIEKAEYHRVLDADAWQKLWTRHAGEVLETPYRIAKFPEVDFANYMVVAVFRGRTVNTRGLTLKSAVDEGERLLVRFDIGSLSYQTMETGDEVAPYGIWVFPRSAIPVVLEEDVQSLIGAPPKWKERARLE